MPDHTDRKLEIVTEVPESAMVVFAHPDDAEIGSGGVIARWVAAGCDVTYVLCTNGDAGTADRNLAPAELAQNRAHEQRAAADFMGVRHVEMLGYPDGFLEDTREFLGDVVRAIRRHRPHTVFVHDPTSRTSSWTSPPGSSARSRRSSATRARCPASTCRRA